MLKVKMLLDRVRKLVKILSELVVENYKQLNCHS